VNKTFKKWLFILGVMILFTSSVTFFFLQELKNIKSSKVHLGSYGKISAFQLQDQKGRIFGSESLKGSPWIADFIFTRCQGPCPLMSKNFSELQKILPKDSPVKLVSFTVDPEYDSVKVLEDYAANYDAQENRWHFLTGTKEEIYRLARADFKVVAGPVPDTESDFIHTVKMVLVDSKGNIRAYYDGTDSESPQEILSDLRDLSEKT